MTKILLVEDDKSLREIYGVRLLAEGYDIVSAGDGEEALAIAIKDRPALIVSDVMMPKISGFDMLDILRSTTETKGIKVIMMTALSSEDQRQRGQQLGADRYLVKSQVGIEDVVRTVHEVLEDAPTSSTDFSSSAPAPSPSTPPQQPPAPAQPAPQQPAAATPPNTPTVSAPAPTPQPSSAPTSAPSPQSTSAASAPSAPTSSPPSPAPLPQPTAPFSTPRPASQSNRIIEPISTEESSKADVADLMQRELSAETMPTATPPQPAPSPEATESTPAQQPPREDHGLNFEETPPAQQPPQQPAA